VTLLVRYGSEERPLVGVLNDGLIHATEEPTTSGLLTAGVSHIEKVVHEAVERPPVSRASDVQLLAPVDGRTEVWGAGVTYLRSRDARIEESARVDVYGLVYDAERPELFFKAPAWRVVGHDATIGIRTDCDDSVAEAELALVIDASGEIAGFTVCNDVTARTIEAENPLYLPQAKSYRRSCALGPGIRLSADFDATNTSISLRVLRDGKQVIVGATRTGLMRRSFSELVSWLTRGIEFPAGVVLATGTGIVPVLGDTLRAGDVVEIEAQGIGTLRNVVQSV
jgi:2-dehydro-3-deoxy-D-arabinonate dehydratase